MSENQLSSNEKRRMFLMLFLILLLFLGIFGKLILDPNRRNGKLFIPRHQFGEKFRDTAATRACLRKRKRRDIGSESPAFDRENILKR